MTSPSRNARCRPWREGQLLVRNLYMSVDPSMRGRLESTEKHYTHNFTPGLAAGRPRSRRRGGEPLPAVPPGTYVRHQLGWRERAVVDAADTDGAGRIDPRTRPTAHVVGAARPDRVHRVRGPDADREVRPGDTVFVSAAAGAVGTAAGQFARLLGAGRVIGTAGGPDKCALLVKEFGYDAAADYRAEPVREALARLAPDGIDVYFDNVGGEQLAAALHALRTGGRVALCGMMSQFGGDATVRRHQPVDPGGPQAADAARASSSATTTTCGRSSSSGSRAGSPRAASPPARRSWTAWTTPRGHCCPCSAGATSARCWCGWVTDIRHGNARLVSWSGAARPAPVSPVPAHGRDPATV